jgi:hypothetical protein
MNGAGQGIGGQVERGDGEGRGPGWFAGFLFGLGVGTGLAMVILAVSRSARHVELAARIGVDGSVELVLKVWRPV